jgi:hypothetical protein
LLYSNDVLEEKCEKYNIFTPKIDLPKINFKTKYLKIYFELRKKSVLTQISAISLLITYKKHYLSLFSTLENFLNDSTLCDFEIINNNDIIKTHKIILYSNW